jgi:hypothetical protein
MEDTPVRSGRADASQANVAVGLAAATLVVWVILGIAQAESAIWLVVAALGAVTAFFGWRAGAGSRPTGRALAAVVVGVLAFLTVIGWGIVEAVA